MLRPDMVIAYAKQRGERQQTDFLQLVDGINLGGRIVVGGDHKNSRAFLNVMRQQNRLGVVLSVQEIKDSLDPVKTYSFDVVAIAQLLMVAKNEAFHQTIDSVITLLQRECVEEGRTIEMGLQLLREQADQIGHL